MESSQKESLQKQFDLLSRQETGLKTLEDSINQGTSLFRKKMMNLAIKAHLLLS